MLICVRNSNYDPGVDSGGLMRLNLNVKSVTQLVSWFCIDKPLIDVHCFGCYYSTIRVQ